MVAIPQNFLDFDTSYVVDFIFWLGSVLRGSCGAWDCVVIARNFYPYSHKRVL